jgi:hypothetical protein
VLWHAYSSDAFVALKSEGCFGLGACVALRSLEAFVALRSAGALALKLVNASNQS